MVRELYLKAFHRPVGISVIGCASSCDEIIRTVSTRSVDVALISAALDDGPFAGIMALERIRASYPNVKPVMLLQESEIQLVTIAFRAGAKGIFFPEKEGFAMLCRCVRKVHDGQIWASSAHLHELLEAFARQVPRRIVDFSGVRLLTKREEDVVRLVEDGLTNRQIAHSLALSEHTVRNNLFRIFDKLGVSTRVELALYSANHTNSFPLGAAQASIETAVLTHSSSDEPRSHL
jgi:DNA-binding NarL/FixJ family response regulator